MEESTIEMLNSYSKYVESLDISNKNIKGLLDLDGFDKLKKLVCSNNKIDLIINLPDSLKYLDCSYNLIEQFNCISNNLDYFNCKKNPLTILYYSFDVKPKSYPKKLQYLRYSNIFNQPVDNLSNSITELIFGNSFNQHVDNLPNSITHLTFGNSFNQPVDNLPNSITHLTFGNSFNQPVDNLPNSITHLTFGNSFNQPVDNFPNSITHLTFGDSFNQPVNNLPNSLIELEFGLEFNQPIDKIYSKCKQNSGSNQNSGIVTLGFGDKFNQPIDILQTKSCTCCANSLKNLFLGESFGKSINNIPKSVEHLIVYGNEYYKNNKEHILDTVRYLDLFGDNNQEIIEFPKNLNYLILNSNYSHNINNLPESIIEIRIYNLEQKKLISEKYHDKVVLTKD